MTQWQIEDTQWQVPQDDLYTLAWEAEFSGHLFDIRIIYTDPNAIDVDENYTQGPDFDIIPRSYFHDSSDGQNRETRPTFDPTVLHSSNPKSHGQSQDIETPTDLAQKDNSEQTFEPSTDAETACDPIPQPPPRRSDNPSTLEINDPTTESIPPDELTHSRGGKYNLRPNPNPNYSEL